MGVPAYVQNLRQKIGNDLLLLPSVCGLVFNDRQELLLGRRSDNGTWAPIGGSIDPGEQPADAVVREVWEETGVHCVPERITGVYLTPLTTYANGHQAQFIITTFRCRHLGGTPCVNDEESLEVRYFAMNELPAMRPHHLERIEHALREGPAYFAPPTGMPG